MRCYSSWYGISLTTTNEWIFIDLLIHHKNNYSYTNLIIINSRLIPKYSSRFSAYTMHKASSKEQRAQCVSEMMNGHSLKLRWKEIHALKAHFILVCIVPGATGSLHLFALIVSNKQSASLLAKMAWNCFNSTKSKSKWNIVLNPDWYKRVLGPFC